MEERGHVSELGQVEAQGHVAVRGHVEVGAGPVLGLEAVPSAQPRAVLKERCLNVTSP